MALTDKLRDLDQRLLPVTRDDGEDAETYLRRGAASRAISPAQAGDVMAALRVYFDVQPDVGDDENDDGSEDGAEEQKDEADEESADEKDEADDSDDGEDDEKS